ncbi:unnamed protein product [Brassica oleracea var. botrytis]
MFQMSCNENTDCEILSAMDCESCLKSDAVTYCPLHNKLLCYYCDIKIHLPEPVPPLLELEIERLSPTFIVGTYRLILPPTFPAAVAKETYTPAPHHAASE